MSDFIVYTYDNIDAIAAVLNGIASIMGGGSSGYREMIKTLGILGLLVSVVAFLVNPTRIAGFSWFGGFMFVYFLLFLPVTRVNIVDVVRTGQARTIENVPAALAITASVSSTVGLKLTRAFETAMQVIPIPLGDGSLRASACETSPSTECMFRFSQGGMMFGNKLLSRIEQVSRESSAALNTLLDRDIHEFLAQCTAFDLSQKRIGYDEISNATDLWRAIANTSPARYVTESGVFKDCPSAYDSLGTRRQALGDKLEELVARSVFPNLEDSDAQRRLNNAYKDVAAATGVGNASWEVKQFLLQNTLINQAKRGLGRMGMEAGSTSAVMLGHAEAVTFAGANSSFITQSRLAEEALPLIRNGIETILYGIFPVVVLVMMVQSGPGLVTAIKGFVFAFIWIQLWPPLYALVNYIGQVKSMQTLRIIVDTMREGASAEAVGLAYSNYNNIYNGQISDQAVMGYLVIAVPVIASSIIYGMNSAMGSIGGASFVSSAGRAGEAAGAGNVGIGNASIGQQSLGPSRTDADVFSANTTGGSFKFGLAEGGAQYLGGQFNATQGPFRISLASQNISALKDSYAEKIGASEAETSQLSSAISAAFSHNVANNKEFAHFVESKTGSSVRTSSSSGTSVTDASSVGSSADHSKGATTAASSGSAVNHSAKLGASILGSGAGKDVSADHARGNSTQHSAGVTESGQKNLSTQEQISMLKSYDQSKDFGTGDRQTVSSSSGRELNFQEASQQLDSLQRQISHAKEVSLSLETMEANKATVEQDLVHRATRALNNSMGDATYVSRLSDDDKREQLTAYAVNHLLVDQYGLDKGDAASLISSSREHHSASSITGGVGDAAAAGGLGTSDQGAFMRGGGRALSGRDYQSPSVMHDAHKAEFSGNATRSGGSGGPSVGQDVMQNMADIGSRIESKSTSIRSNSDHQVSNATNAVSGTDALIANDGKALHDATAAGTVAKGFGLASADLAKAGDALTGGALGLTDRAERVEQAASLKPR